MQISGTIKAPSLEAVVLDGRSPGTGVTIGLLGRGIGASLSPLMHEEEGRRLGLDYRYYLIDFDRLGWADADLAAVLDDARSLGFAGLNVTYPFKQAVLPLLDAVAPDAAAIGAVNTVVFEPGRSVGHNTDCWGFGRSFVRGLPGVPRQRVLQLGSGGAGAAVAQALLQQGVRHLDIFDSMPDRAEALAIRLRQQFDATVAMVDDPATALSLADGLVNTTPVGMAKHPGTPIAPELLKPSQWVADVIYFPLETELIRKADALGCAVLPGGGMAVYQAVGAFRLFSGIEANPEAMTRTFEEAVKTSW